VAESTRTYFFSKEKKEKGRSHGSHHPITQLDEKIIGKETHVKLEASDAGKFWIKGDHKAYPL
jgi:hypothetical protein